GGGRGGGGGGGGGANANASQPALTVGTDERTNSLVVRCSDLLANDIRELVKELEQTPAAGSAEVVRIVPLPRGVDPNLIQAALDAVQGVDPNIRIQQQQRMSGLGSAIGGARGFGPGGFGGGGL